jgi:sec-independent protein translocase protein TatC
MARIRPVRHEDRLTLVEHLDELRTRLIVSGVTLLVAFCLCFWQNELIFDLLNDPLPGGREPVTLGVTEPFLTTATVAGYSALLLTLPVILFQLYAFVLPAFSPSERRVALPILLLFPFLFVAGIVFCYFVVLTPAIDFLTTFNDDQFQIEVRARDYYSFVLLTLVSLGLLFQIPMVIIAITRLGIVTPRQLRRSRRYAYVGIAVLAALLPTMDPVTMLLEMVPLLILYELSIVLASLLGRTKSDPAPAAMTPEGSG